MLSGEVVKELVAGDGSSCLHVLQPSSHAFDRLQIVLPLPIEIVREGIVERISGTLPMSTRVLLELRESFGFDR